MSNTRTIHPAESFCRSIIEKNPKAPEYAGLYRDVRAEFGENRWPEWCYITTDVVNALLPEKKGGHGSPGKTLKDMYTLMAALRWIKGGAVFKFDDTLSTVLSTQMFDPDIPFKVFDQLARPCIFVEKEIMFGAERANGFFAWFDWNVDFQRKEMHFLHITGDGLTLYQCIPFVGSTIGDALDTVVVYFSDMLYRQSFANRVEAMGATNYVGEYIGQVVSECISPLLYLCAQGVDIVDAGSLYDGGPAVYDVGCNVGNDLREKGVDFMRDSGRTNDARWEYHYVGAKDNGRRPAFTWVPPSVLSEK